MNTQFSFKNVSEKDKKFLTDYFTNKKQERIKTLLSDQDFSNAELNIRTEKFAKKEAFKVELTLRLPGHEFLASEDDHTINEAFDLALDKLIIQLRKAHEKQKDN